MTGLKRRLEPEPELLRRPIAERAAGVEPVEVDPPRLDRLLGVGEAEAAAD